VNLIPVRRFQQADNKADQHASHHSPGYTGRYLAAEGPDSRAGSDAGAQNGDERIVVSHYTRSFYRARKNECRRLSQQGNRLAGKTAAFTAIRIPLFVHEPCHESVNML
jgi:hypothetical protein